jgi:hypothetical protein
MNIIDTALKANLEYARRDGGIPHRLPCVSFLTRTLRCTLANR